MTGDKKTIARRRDFLHGLGLGALSAGAMVAANSSLVTNSRADTEVNDEKRKIRYKETDHVKTYYRVNRYAR